MVLLTALVSAMAAETVAGAEMGAEEVIVLVLTGGDVDRR